MKKKEEAADYSKEIAWLITHRSEDVKAIVRHYKRLSRGRRGEYGVGAALFVSALEAELAVRQLKDRLKVRAKKTVSKKAARRVTR